MEFWKTLIKNAINIYVDNDSFFFCSSVSFFLLIRNICSNIEYKGTFSDYLGMIARKALLVAMNALLKAWNVYLVTIKTVFWLSKLEAIKTLFYTFLISFAGEKLRVKEVLICLKKHPFWYTFFVTTLNQAKKLTICCALL